MAIGLDGKYLNQPNYYFEKTISDGVNIINVFFSDRDDVKLVYMNRYAEKLKTQEVSSKKYSEISKRISEQKEMSKKVSNF